LPNNLTPFVDAGRMRGADSSEEIQAALAQVLYDQVFRSTIGSRPAASADGQSAARSAAAILGLKGAK
jgi:hypothetical protein